MYKVDMDEVMRCKDYLLSINTQTLNCLKFIKSRKVKTFSKEIFEH